jgi:uncharacterized membrane protein
MCLKVVGNIILIVSITTWYEEYQEYEGYKFELSNILAYLCSTLYVIFNISAVNAYS